MFETLKPRKCTILVFFKCHFLIQNVHHSLQKLEMILTLMIRRVKKLELMKIVFIINFSTFGSKVLLTLKIMDFENVHSTKVVHVYVINA